MQSGCFLGLGLVFFGGVAVGFAFQIEEKGLGNSHDPGPQIFPITFGIGLIVGGIYECISFFRAFFQIKKKGNNFHNLHDLQDDQTQIHHNEIHDSQFHNHQSLQTHDSQFHDHESLQSRIHQDDQIQIHQSQIHDRSSGFKEMGIVFFALILYVAMMGFLGFFTSTLIFSVTMMTHLGMKWSVSFCATVALIIIIHLLFVRLFKIPLPMGLIG